MATMNEKYGDGSDHEVCAQCGFCKTCGDCNKYGCGYRALGELSEISETLGGYTPNDESPNANVCGLPHGKD